MLNLVYFAQVSCPLVCMSESSNCYVIYVQLLYWYKIKKNNNFEFRPFLLRYTITIQWLSVIHGLHYLSCIAKIDTKDLSVMKDTLRKDPICNKIIKFSN